MKNGIPVARLIRILEALRIAAPDATADTDDAQLGVLRINYNGPEYLNLGPRAAELMIEAKVALCDGYAEIPIP